LTGAEVLAVVGAMDSSEGSESEGAFNFFGLRGQWKGVLLLLFLLLLNGIVPTAIIISLHPPKSAFRCNCY